LEHIVYKLFRRYTFGYGVVTAKSTVHLADIRCMYFRYRGTVIGTKYWQATGPILLDDVRCAGSEISIAKCRHEGWYQHNCDHDDDVSVSCGSSPVQHGN